MLFLFLIGNQEAFVLYDKEKNIHIQTTFIQQYQDMPLIAF